MQPTLHKLRRMHRLTQKRLRRSRKTQRKPCRHNRTQSRAVRENRIIRGGHTVLQRLLDMGLTPNTKITLLKVAPFDGPIEVSVRGSKLAIGRGIATKVFVDPQIEEKK